MMDGWGTRAFVRRALDRVRRYVNDPDVLYASAPWMDTLKRARDEIAVVGRHPHYLAAYGIEEFRYWSQVPGWIYEDTRDRRPKRCLDVGCAYGTLLLYTKMLTGCDAYGTDFIEGYMSPRLLQKYDIRYCISNVELSSIPWQESFDLIIFTEVLEHLNFQAAPTLRKVAERLTAGGRIYLTTPDAAEWGRVTKYYASYVELPQPVDDGRQPIDDHVWQFDVGELLDVVHAAHLRVVRFAYSPGPGLRHFNLTLAGTT
jgi:SAM-dependent methyltransferase